MTLRRWLIVALAVVLLLAVFAGGWVTARLGLGRTVDPASLTELERQFSNRMSGARLEGFFTIAGGDDRPPRPDSYDLSSVQKIGDDLWRFNVRMRHDDFDVTMPVAVPLRWIGDTPIVMMTDSSIPGLGTFSARVFFYEDRYAGTWQHGPAGGHLYGRIVKSP